MYTIGRLRVIVVILIAIFLQLTLVRFISFYGIQPDIIIIPVVFFGLALGPSRGTEAGLAAGLLKDVFSMDFFGINAFLLTLAGFISGSLGSRLSRDSLGTQCSVTAVMTLLSMSGHYYIASLLSTGLNISFFGYFWAFAVPVSAYTGLLSVPVLAKLMKAFGMQSNEAYL